MFCFKSRPNLSDPEFRNHRKREQHATNFANGRIRYVLEKFRPSPVVALHPNNDQITSNGEIPRHKSFKRETDLYKTSTGSNYGSIQPRRGNTHPEPIRYTGWLLTAEKEFGDICWEKREFASCQGASDTNVALQ